MCLCLWICKGHLRTRSVGSWSDNLYLVIDSIYESMSPSHSPMCTMQTQWNWRNCSLTLMKPLSLMINQLLLTGNFPVKYVLWCMYSPYLVVKQIVTYSQKGWKTANTTWGSRAMRCKNCGLRYRHLEQNRRLRSTPWKTSVAKALW